MACCDCESCCPNSGIAKCQTGDYWKENCDATPPNCCVCTAPDKCPTETPHKKWSPYNTTCERQEDICDCECDPEKAGQVPFTVSQPSGWVYTYAPLKDNEGNDIPGTEDETKKTSRIWYGECPREKPHMDGTQCKCVCRFKENPSSCPGYPNWKPTRDASKCECVCGLTDDICKARDPSKPKRTPGEFDCECYCDKSPGSCPQSTPSFRESDCSCFCDKLDSQGEPICSGETPDFDSEKCECFCAKSPGDCKKGEKLEGCECVPCPNSCKGCEEQDEECNCVGCEDCSQTAYKNLDGTITCCDEGEVLCNGSCVSADCPVGKKWDDKICACKCPTNKNECNGKCYGPCPNGRSRNSSTCQCEPECSDLTCIGCKYPVKKNGVCQCDGCSDCGANKYTDPAGNTVCCRYNQTYCRGVCYNSCPSGRVRDPNTCNCICSAGFELCNGECYLRCGGGKIRMSDCSCECDPDVEPALEECRGQCRRPCEGGKVRNNETCYCECPEGKRWCIEQNSCVDDCEAPFEFSQDGCSCDCPRGQVECGGQCLPACSDGVVRNAQCQCVCPDGYVECKGRCVKVCSDGRPLDANCSCGCLPGQELCVGKCVDSCSGGKVMNNECRCECPWGQKECKNGNCHSGICLANQRFNPETCKCECIPGTPGCCGIGTVFCNGNCYNKNCPPGQTFDYSYCGCICGTGQDRCGDLCYNKCEEEQNRNPDTCECCTPGEPGCCTANQTVCGGNCVNNCEGSCEVLDPNSCECVCDNTQCETCNGVCYPICREDEIRDDDCSCYRQAIPALDIELLP